MEIHMYMRMERNQSLLQEINFTTMLFTFVFIFNSSVLS